MKIGNIIHAASRDIVRTGNTIAPANRFEPFSEEAIQQPVHRRFESMVLRDPSKLAVTCGGASYTYDELNRRSNRLARVIRRHMEPCEEGAQPLTALLFHHNGELAVGILGALKAGTAYVPLDPSYPEGRLQTIIEDAGIDVMVTERALRPYGESLVAGLKSRVSVIDISALDSIVPDHNLALEVDPGQWAYILYTSGSTGRPKGVVQSHRNLLHHCRVYTNALHIYENDRLSLFSSYGFDAAKMDIYGALLNGATLYPFDVKAGLANLPRWLEAEAITIYHSIPTVYRYFLEELAKTAGRQARFPALRLVVLGGEAALRRDVERYQELLPDHCLMINGLGPTESTLTLQYFMNKETNLRREAAPVGFGVDKTEVLLLDSQNCEAPVYGTGEIVYKSDYLALGYLNNPEKTHQAFMTDPITGEGRVYRSGDLGRRLPDGNIEYAGRGDSQVKVSGYRIELPEIESMMDRHPGIAKSVVVAQPDPAGDNQLIAYYTTADAEDLDEGMVVRELKKTLPGYMIPRLLFRVDSFPLTGTGKIDRKALALKDTADLLPKGEFIPPRNPIERTLAAIWTRILDVGQIGLRDNFFVLGGNSLRAVVLVSNILKELKVKLPLTDVFRHATLEEMARAVVSSLPALTAEIAPVEERDVYPQSQAQQRIFFLHQLNPNGTAYNLFAGLSIEAPVDRSKMERVMGQLVRRHEGLRTSFHLSRGQPIQKVRKDVHFGIESIEGEDGDIEAILKRFIRPFDLSSAPLLRVGLTMMEDGRCLLLYDIHHIVGDGVSISVLIDDFIRLHREEPLPPLRVQYKDYVLWKQKMETLHGDSPGAAYWRRVYGPNEELPLLELPTDFPRPLVMGHAGDQCEFTLDPHTTTAMRELSLQTGTSLYMVVLAVYNILLARLGGIEDIVVGSVTSGRAHPDIEPVVGVFVNLLAMRNAPRGELSFSQFLENVRQNTLDAFEHNDYPFEKLVERLGDRRSDRHPVASVGFTFQNFEAREAKQMDPPLAGMEMMPLKSLRKTALNDINLEAFDKGDRLHFMVQYSTALFRKTTIEAFIDYFKIILVAILQRREIKISDIRLMSEHERKTITSTIQSAQENVSIDFDF